MHSAIRNSTIFLIIITLLILSACGRKGDLTLPESTALTTDTTIQKDLNNESL